MKKKSMMNKLRNLLARHKKDIIYILIIINIIVWSTSYVTTKNFYNEWTKIQFSTVHAQERLQVEMGAKDQTIEEYVLGEAVRRGLNPNKVWSIIQCESGWNPYAINKNSNGTYDIGLFQLNEIHNIPRECSFSYRCATNEAFNLRIRQGHWGAWVCANKLGIK